MVTALCFITTDPDRVNDVGSAIARLAQVRAVYSVTGELDLVAIVEVPELDAVPMVVTDGIAGIPGVTTTETHIAFRTYRPDDLEAGFSLGY